MGVGGPVEFDDDLADLVRSHGAWLLRVAYQLTHDRAAAQDLVQESLLQVYRARAVRDHQVDNLRAYLRRVMINEYLRTRRLRSSSEVITAAIPDQATPVGFEDAHAAQDSMWRALAGLAMRPRTALVLRYYEDLPDREIAALLSCRPATVRSLIARGLATLRQQAAIGPNGPDGQAPPDLEPAIAEETL